MFETPENNDNQMNNHMSCPPEFVTNVDRVCYGKMNGMRSFLFNFGKAPSLKSRIILPHRFVCLMLMCLWAVTAGAVELELPTGTISGSPTYGPVERISTQSGTETAVAPTAVVTIQAAQVVLRDGFKVREGGQLRIQGIPAGGVAPAITTEPVAQSVVQGQAATFSVITTGYPTPTYQWRKNGTAISGATSASYMVVGTIGDHGAVFSVVASNGLGSVTSANAALTVWWAPVITTQPQPQSVMVGQTATFAVSANGNPAPAFQWSKNGVAISGATAASYTTPAVTYSDAGALFRVVVSNPHGSVTSNSATCSIVNTAPTVATVSSATPNPVTGTAAALSVMGADDQGETALIYSWSTTGTPPAVVSFSANGSNAAKQTTATFAAPGNYQLLATVRDAGNLTVTSAVTVTVVQTVSTVTVTPATAHLNPGATQAYAAQARDQFGVVMSSQPTFTWTMTPSGTVTATGVATAPSTAGSYVVRATAGSANSTASLVVNAAPTIATVPSVTPNPVTGTTAALSVLGADDQGEAALSYTWATTGTPPAAVSFGVNGTNAAKQTTATFAAVGSYQLLVTIRDAGNLVVTSAVTVTVVPTPMTVTVTPSTTRLNPGATQAYVAQARDQFGVVMSSQPTFTWTMSPSGTVTASGVATAPSTAGPYVVRATAGSANGTASLVVNAAPTVATVSSATPNPVTGTTAVLNVLGADDQGEAALSYTWSTTGTPPASVTFSVNGSNAAKSTVASFAKAGTYSVQCTIVDGGGLSVASNLTFSVGQTLTTMVVTPTAMSIIPSATLQFTATGRDQFGIGLLTQPTKTWSVSGGGAISASGLFTAGTTTGGPYTVQAMVGGVIGTTTVSVIPPPTVVLYSTPSFIFESGGVATVTAALSSVQPVSITVNLNFGGTADATDYTASSGQIIIPAGQLTGNMTVTATADALAEGIETVTADIISAVNAVELDIQRALIRILDHTGSPNGRWYVDSIANGGGTGLSWPDAFDSLDDALLVAQAGEEIWIADGVYVPRASGRTATFTVPAGVKVIGGFLGTETTMTQRQVTLYEAILSGNRGDRASHADNCQTVVTLGAGATLDGLTISDGVGEGATGPASQGGGVVIVSGGTLRNCTFVRNRAINGGALWIAGGAVILDDCTFSDNSASVRAGAIFAEGGDLTIRCCRFIGSRAVSGAGALHITTSGPMRIAQSAFIDNRATGTGAAGALAAGATTTLTHITNCVFSRNVGDTGGAVAVAMDAQIENSLLVENAARVGGALSINGGTLRVLNATIAANTASSLGGGLYAAGGTTEILNGIVWGNIAPAAPSAYGTGGTTRIRIGQSGIAGGATGIVIAGSAIREDLGGIIGGDPLFAAGTYALTATSPCIDRGLAEHLPFDVWDLDADGNVSEILPIDLAGALRVSGVPDLGAFEFGATTVISVQGYTSDPIIAPPSGRFINRLDVTVLPRQPGDAITISVVGPGQPPGAFTPLTGTLPVTSSATVHARATAPGSLPSRTISRTYTRADLDVAFVNTESEIYESRGSAKVMVERTEHLDLAVPVRFSVQSINAGANYATAADAGFGTFTAWFSPGSRRATLPVAISNDTEVEGPERFQIVILSDASIEPRNPVAHTVTIRDNDLPAPVITSWHYNADHLWIVGTVPRPSEATEIEVVSSNPPLPGINGAVTGGTFRLELNGYIPLDASQTVSFAFLNDRGHRGPVTTRTFNLPRDQSSGGDSFDWPAPEAEILGFDLTVPDRTGDLQGSIPWSTFDSETNTWEEATKEVRFTNKTVAVSFEIDARIPGYGRLHSFRVHRDNEPSDWVYFNPGSGRQVIPISLDEGINELFAEVRTENRGSYETVFSESISVLRDSIAPTCVALVPDAYRDGASFDPLDPPIIETDRTIFLNGNDLTTNIDLRQRFNMNVLSRAGLVLPIMVDDVSGLSRIRPIMANTGTIAMAVSPRVVNGADVVDVSGFENVPDDLPYTQSMIGVTDKSDQGDLVQVDTVPHFDLLAASPSGSGVVRIDVTDRCGNRSNVSVITCKVDTQPPIAPAPMTGVIVNPLHVSLIARDVLRVWQGNSIASATELKQLHSSNNAIIPAATSLTRDFPWLIEQPIHMGMRPGAQGDGHGETVIILQDFAGNISPPWRLIARRGWHFNNQYSEIGWHGELTYNSQLPEPAHSVRKNMANLTAVIRDGVSSDVSLALLIPDFHRPSQPVYALQLPPSPGMYQGDLVWETPELTSGDSGYGDGTWYRWILAFTRGEMISRKSGNLATGLGQILPMDSGPDSELRRFIPPILSPHNSNGPTISVRLRDQGVADAVSLGAISATMNMGSGAVSLGSPTPDVMSATATNSSVAGFRTVNYQINNSSQGIRFLNTGYRWANVVEARDENGSRIMVRAGEVARIRLKAGFFKHVGEASSFNPLGDYVRFIDSVTSADLTLKISSLPSAEIQDRSGKIAIVGQRLRTLSGMMQEIELDIEVGENVSAHMFHFDVRLGEVKGYSDSESIKQQGFSFNGGLSHRMFGQMSVWTLRLEPVEVFQLESRDIAAPISFAAGHLTSAEAQAVEAAVRIYPTDVQPTAFVLQNGVTEFRRLPTYTAPYNSDNSATLPASGFRILGGKLPLMEDSQLEEFEVGMRVKIEFPKFGAINSTHTQTVTELLPINVLRREAFLEADPAGYNATSPAPWGTDGLLGDIGTVIFASGLDDALNLQPTSGLLGVNGRFNIQQSREYQLLLSGKQRVEILSWVNGTSFKVRGVQPGGGRFLVSPIIDGSIVSSDGIYDINVSVDLPVMMEPTVEQVFVARQNIMLRKQRADQNQPLEDDEEQQTPLPGEVAYRMPPLFALNGGALTLSRDGQTLPTTDTARMLDGVYEQALFLASQILPAGEAVAHDMTGDVPSGDWHWYTPYRNMFGRGYNFSLPLTSESGTQISLLTMSRFLAADLAWTGGPHALRNASLGELTGLINARLRKAGPPQRIWERLRFIRGINGRIQERPEILLATANDTAQSVEAVEMIAKEYIETASLARMLRFCSLFLGGDGGALSWPGLSTDSPLQHYGTGISVERGLWDDFQSIAKWDAPLSDIFHDSPIPLDWNVGHPWTESIVGHMVAQRIDLTLEAEAASGPGPFFRLEPGNDAHIATADRAAIQALRINLEKDDSGEIVLQIDPSQLRPATNMDPVFTLNPQQWVQRQLDLAMTDDQSGSLHVLIGRENIGIVFRATDPTLNIDDWSFSFYVVDEDGLHVAPTYSVPIIAAGAHATLARRCLMEIAMLRRALDQRFVEAYYQTANPLISTAYRLGSVFGVDSAYRSLTGKEFETGQKLSNAEQLEARFAISMEFLPIGKLVKVAGIAGRRLFSVTASTAGRSFRRVVADNAASRAAGSQMAAILDRLAGAVAPLGDGVRRGAAGMRRITDDAIDTAMHKAVEVSALFLARPKEWVRMVGGRAAVAVHLGLQKGATVPGVGVARRWVTATKRALTSAAEVLRAPRTGDEFAQMEYATLREEIRRTFSDVEARRILAALDRGPGCFTGDTPVLLANGSSKPIADIHVGDVVLTRPEKQPEAQPQMGVVSKVFVRTRVETLTLTLHRAGNGGEDGDPDAATTLTTTAAHPFWVVGRGWYPAGALNPGDVVRGLEHDHIILDVAAGAVTTVYNLEIANTRTYFVLPVEGVDTAAAVWVHNVCRDLKEFGKMIDELTRPSKYSAAEKGKWWTVYSAQKNPHGVPGVVPKGLGRGGAKLKQLIAKHQGISPDELKRRFPKHQGHHLIPQNVAERSDFLRQIGFTVEAVNNGILLPSNFRFAKRTRGTQHSGVAVHRTSHPGYDEAIAKKLEEFELAFARGDLTPQQANDKVTKLLRALRGELRKPGGLSLYSPGKTPKQSFDEWQALLDQKVP